jgi:hypothetical protein
MYPVRPSVPDRPAAASAAWSGLRDLGVEAPLVASAGDLAGEPVAVVAVGDRGAHRGVRGAWAQRPVLGDVDAVVQAVALKRDGELLPGLGELGIGGGARRSRAASRRLRLIGRTVGRRVGQAGGAHEQVLAWTAETGELVRRSIREARRLAAEARAKARGRGAVRKLAAAAHLDELADRAEKVARQITQRVAGEKISDRLVSMADPDARAIGKGKLGKRYEFG